MESAEFAFESTSIMNASQSQLDSLFPTPPPLPPSDVAPTRLPGWSSDSTEAVLELLKDNHKKWHIFFNDKKFHKCVRQRLLLCDYS